MKTIYSIGFRGCYLRWFFTNCKILHLQHRIIGFIVVKRNLWTVETPFLFSTPCNWCIVTDMCYQWYDVLIDAHEDGLLVVFCILFPENYLEKCIQKTKIHILIFIRRKFPLIYHDISIKKLHSFIYFLLCTVFITMTSSFPVGDAI